jgi:hypothetical protein
MLPGDPMPKRPRDANLLGKFIVDVATGSAPLASEDKRDPVAVAHGTCAACSHGNDRF